MTTPALTGVDRLTRLTRKGPLAPDASNALPARPCRCDGPELAFGPRGELCFKCGRARRALTWMERTGLWDEEAYALLGAAVEAERRELRAAIHEATGCDGLGELLRETYWLRDALRSGWVPA